MKFKIVTPEPSEPITLPDGTKSPKRFKAPPHTNEGDVLEGEYHYSLMGNGERSTTPSGVYFSAIRPYDPDHPVAESFRAYSQLISLDLVEIVEEDQ